MDCRTCGAAMAVPDYVCTSNNAKDLVIFCVFSRKLWFLSCFLGSIHISFFFLFSLTETRLHIALRIVTIPV